MNLYDDLKQEIESQYKKHQLPRPFIVAIDGLGGAGKTSLVRQLQRSLDNTVILHIDDHIVLREKRYNTGYDEWFEYYHLQWDTAYLQENLFKKLHQDIRQLQLLFYDKEEDNLTQHSINIPLKGIVIIEGVFLLREEWKTYYDFTIFLDCPSEIRYERVLHRDKYLGNFEERLKKYQNRYWRAEDYYFKMQEPLKYADRIKKCTDR